MNKVGITPAHAGNTQMVFRSVLPTKDHPRACGEYHNGWRYRRENQGSPPRMRGILSERLSDCRISGITPAHAGNTKDSTTGTGDVKDHPRACGEYLHKLTKKEIWQGSPPRMRGIPPSSGSVANRPRDHPRACGEYWRFTKLFEIEQGSPPRMRGIRTGQI